MYYQISCKNSCRKTIEATMMKKAPNESKLIYIINNLIVVSLCLLISYGSQLNTQTNKRNVNENRDKKIITIKRFFYF